MERENLQWSNIFIDKPVPKETLDCLQAQIMAQIEKHPVDFGAEIRLAARHKWGLGLAFSLVIMGLMFWTALWFGSEMVFRGLGFLIGYFAGIPYISEFRQFEQEILQIFKYLQDLMVQIYLLWEVVSWPLLGVLSIIVVFRNSNDLNDESTIEEV